jgi:CRISPR-associated protein Csm2
MPTNDANIRKIILDSDAGKLVDEAQALGEELAAELKTSQLRNIFGAIRQTQMRWDTNRQEAYQEIILLQPKLAYYTKRAPSMRPLKGTLDVAITLLRADKQPDEIHFKNFVNFCEAIVAYHRFYRKDRD